MLVRQPKYNYFTSCYFICLVTTFVQNLIASQHILPFLAYFYNFLSNFAKNNFFDFLLTLN